MKISWKDAKLDIQVVNRHTSLFTEKKKKNGERGCRWFG